MDWIKEGTLIWFEQDGVYIAGMVEHFEHSKLLISVIDDKNN